MSLLNNFKIIGMLLEMATFRGSRDKIILSLTPLALFISNIFVECINTVSYGLISIILFSITAECTEFEVFSKTLTL